MGSKREIDLNAPQGFFDWACCDAHRVFGCHPSADGRGFRFALWAPNAKSVSLLGDFADWDTGLPMERLDWGAWAVEVPGARRGQVYKYAVTGCDGRRVLKSDPYAFHCETGPATGSKVWDLGGYAWGDGEYMSARADKDIYASPMSIYEIHIGSWRILPEGSVFPWYRAVGEALAEYCIDMGYTHVELLPICEFPYEPSWGYQVTGYFAPTSRYGTPQDFMYMVDVLHRAGIGVIMDWVPAHFPRDEYGLARFDGSPVYERSDPHMAAHPDWGTLIFDYEKPAVKSFLLSSAALFLEEYHIDGFRVDAVSSMLYLGFGRGDDYVRNRLGGDIDLAAVDFLKAFNGLVKSRGGITVAEESSSYPGVTARAEEGGLGFSFKWDMGFMHDTIDYMKLDPLWRGGSHNKLSFSMMYAFSEHFILAYSHDEVVHGKCSMLGKMSGLYDDKFSNLRALYGFQFAHPGKKLTFMGSDFGQFIEWDFKKELDWFLRGYPKHGGIECYVRELNRFYTHNPEFFERDFGWDGFDWLNVDDADRSCIAFMRISGSGGKIVCACNFTPMQWELQVGLPSRGKLRAMLSSDEKRFGGSASVRKRVYTAKKQGFFNHPYSAFITLPPLSCTYYRYEEGTK